MSHLRVVHLSDLHAHGDTELEQRVIARAAIEDVGRIHDERPVDLVVFSGDLAFSGGTDEFTAAQEYFLDPLGERLGLTHERIILVPGNHDVDRSRIDQYFEKGLGDSLTGSDAVRAFLANSQAITHAIAPLEPWREFHAHYYDGVESLEPTSLGWVHKFELGDFSVAIAALNSAWRASGDSDHGAILLGEPQIRSALESIADADLKLAASHHPLSWLARFDGDAARREFETRAMLVLSGHEHAADPVSELSPRGGALYSRAGCLYETTDYLNGYSVLDLDAHRSATVTMRTWWPERGVFDEATNVAEHGQVTYPWPGASLPAAITSVDYSSVMLSLTQTLQDRSAVAPEVEELKLQSVDDVLVEPRYWPVPYQEIVAARNVDPEKAPDPHSGIDALEASRVLVVAGPPESGVTSSLLWLLGQHFKVTGTRLPVYVPFAGSFNASQFERTLRGALAAVGLPVERGDELPPLVTAIDDLGTARAGPLDGLCRYVGDHPDQLFVLGCKEDEADRISEALGQREVTFETLFLGPFGRRQLRELLNKLAIPAPAELMGRITSLIRSQGLPRTPFVMSALISVLQTEAEPGTLNVSALLDAYVRLLLGVEDYGTPTHGMDLRRREHLLSFLASRLQQEADHHLSRRDAEEAVSGYFRSRGWSPAISPGEVIGELIQRRVLIQAPDGFVGFRHPAFRFLFTAKWMIDNAAFAETILADPLPFGESVTHAAGLVRSEPATLRAVRTAAMATVGDIQKDVDVQMFDAIRDKPGWSNEDPSVDQLKRALARKPEPTARIDERLDAIDDHLDYPTESDRDALALPERYQKLASSMNLLAHVLRSSELVDDVELKVDCFKDAIHGWSLFTVAWAVNEDQTERLRARFVQMLGDGDNSDSDNPDDPALARLFELYLLMLIVLSVSQSFTSIHLEGVVARALDDDEFMQPTAHALLATMSYCLLKGDGWARRLVALYDSHRDHPVIEQFVRAYALSSYRGMGITESDRDTLERFLADTYAPHARGVQGRAIARSEVLEELRESRPGRTRRKSPGGALPPGDEIE